MEEDYDYSDSFVSDDEPDRSVKGTGGRQNKKGYTEPKRKSVKNIYAPSSRVSSRRNFNTMRGRGGKNTGRTSSHVEKPDGVVQRMLSAKNLKINELRNQVEDLHTALRDVKEENKLLKKMQHRQEKALTKYEDTESDLPQILQRHQNEVKTLKENLRKTREKYERTDRYLRDAEDELDKVKSKLKRYKNLADQQNLLEREDLQKKNHQMEIDMEEKDVKIKELERHINNLNKNHRHELGIEIARNRELQKQLEGMRTEKEELDRTLREKEKEIQIKNIYANRARAPQRLPASYGGTPHDTPPPRPRKRAPSLHDLTPRDKAKMYEEKRREEEKKVREKQPRGGKARNAFQFTAEPKGYSDNDDKSSSGPQNDRVSGPYNSKSSYMKLGSGDSRSRDFSHKKEEDMHDFDTRPWFDGTTGDHSSTYRKPNTDKRARDTHHRFDNINMHATRGAKDYGYSDKKPPLPSSNKGYGFKFSESTGQHEQLDRARREQEDREREETERKQAAERERRERMEWDRKEKDRIEREEKERREREQKAREEEDWRLTMERERLKREQEERDRELKEREDRLRKEREEKERRERERKEQERRAHEEMERIKMDKQLDEERRKKDELLAKLKQIDEGQNVSKQETKKKEPVDSFFVTSGVRDKENSLGSATSSKNSYTFTKPVENLHSGKPSREDNSVPYLERMKKKEGTDEFGGGYQPSFGGSTTTQKTTAKKTTGSLMFNDDFTSTSKPKPKEKKSNLMKDLFGDQTATKSKNLDDDDDLFKPSKSTKTSVNATKSSFPWDDDDTTTTKRSLNKRENSTSALFAGGNAIIDDDLPQKNDSKMLPRRPRQTTTTFAARPAVTAVDHYDEDIEEVIL